MKWWQKYALSFILAVGVSVVPGLAQAQNYSQDFSATFPPDVEIPGKVTVIMTNELDETIVPYVDFEVPGLFDYVGRHQFGARTGGANANQEVSAVASTYTLNGVDRDVVYEIDPLPETGGPNYEPDLVLDDEFITMSEDGIGGVNTRAAWDVQDEMGYNDGARHNFQFRISGIGDPGNDQGGRHRLGLSEYRQPWGYGNRRSRCSRRAELWWLTRRGFRHLGQRRCRGRQLGLAAL